MNMLMIRLWEDCNNACNFCYLKDKKSHTLSQKQKIYRLGQIKQYLAHVNITEYDTIGIIGGEFFQGQLTGIEKEWLEFIIAINDLQINKVVIDSNLLGNYMLEETIRSCTKYITIGTSYDTVGRFRGNKDLWLRNVDLCHQLGCGICVTSIITDDFLEDTTQMPQYVFNNIIEPYTSEEWFKNVSIPNYHSALIESCKKINLPSRKKFLRWGMSHKKHLYNFVHFKENHASKIIAFNDNDELYELWEDRYNSNLYINNVCGHPLQCLCYNDSDKCIMCDAELILEN